MYTQLMVDIINGNGAVCVKCEGDPIGNHFDIIDVARDRGAGKHEHGVRVFFLSYMWFTTLRNILGRPQ